MYIKYMYSNLCFNLMSQWQYYATVIIYDKVAFDLLGIVNFAFISCG